MPRQLVSIAFQYNDYNQSLNADIELALDPILSSHIRSNHLVYHILYEAAVVGAAHHIFGLR